VLNQAACFADIENARLYLTAVDLANGMLHIFGDDCAESVVDAVMASTAIQPFFAPWRYRGRSFVDGGLISNLPLQAAMERGATEIFALDVTVGLSGETLEQDLFGILRQEAYLVIDQMRKQELLRVRAGLGNRLHHLHFTGYPGLMPFDFSQTRAMIEEGERVAAAYLDRLERAGYSALKWLQRSKDKKESRLRENALMGG
jgi:NTE family protein